MSKSSKSPMKPSVRYDSPQYAKRQARKVGMLQKKRPKKARTEGDSQG
jgi:hypothetical protein